MFLFNIRLTHGVILLHNMYKYASPLETEKHSHEKPFFYFKKKTKTNRSMDKESSLSPT